jgi:hypothetical protein
MKYFCSLPGRNRSAHGFCPSLRQRQAFFAAAVDISLSHVLDVSAGSRPANGRYSMRTEARNRR